PPNVTGQLTLGHVFNNTIQDVLIRYHRLKGFEVLWLPGMDHAGIATQVVVEEKLARENKSRVELGREGFIEEVWRWKEHYAAIIRKQFNRMGCSLDWTREKFTLDEDLSRAVIKVFVWLYNKKLIYRGRYIVNWCPRCRTAISDEQVEDIKEPGKLYYIRYPFENSSEYITVATTRPETMLGDTAVCVHPEDKRYQDKIGRILILPLMNRKIPLIADSYVDPSFGTGALKVTPAHDKFDFALAQKHLLEIINIMNEDATINENGGVYKGLDRMAAREKVIADLKDLGLIEKIEDYEVPLGHCERCSTPIEPRISLQWFVQMRPLAEPALKAVREKEITIYPERWVNLYNHWMENVRDWCISRQLWWGHRIPVYYCKDCRAELTDETEDRGIIVAEAKPAQCPVCGSTRIEQDEDVLDTWFSSWLWPFSTLGWPEKTQDYENFYPTSILVSGWEIIYLWIARMIMAGIEFTGQKPFSEVYFHGLIRDEKGQKMSKSLGNSPDPIELMDKYGADALRFGLLLITPRDRDVLFSVERIEAGRNFANKLWNSGRFLWLNTKGLTMGLPRQLTPIDRWIISKLAKLVESVERYLKRFELNQAAKEIYDFTWHHYCDWYIEYTKSEMIRRGEVFDVGIYIFKNLLILLHPFMPFITEELYQRLSIGKETLWHEQWPAVKVPLPDDAHMVDALISAIEAVRNLRSAWRVPAQKKTECFLKIEDEDLEEIFRTNLDFFKTQANVDSLIINITPPKPFSSTILKGVEVYLPLTGSVDLGKELKRLKDELNFLENRINEIEHRLSDEQFQRMASEEVKQREANRLSDFSKKRDGIRHLLETIEA
ncbi:MAG: valine--tRNA ligase, partial [candidate division WOR-3 bacterium]